VGGSGFRNPFVAFTVDRQHSRRGAKPSLFHCEDTTFTQPYGTAAFGISESLSSATVTKNSDQSFSLKG